MNAAELAFTVAARGARRTALPSGGIAVDGPVVNVVLGLSGVAPKEVAMGPAVVANELVALADRKQRGIAGLDGHATAVVRERQWIGNAKVSVRKVLIKDAGLTLCVCGQSLINHTQKQNSE